MAYATINTYDYNPVHSIWQCLLRVGFPENWMNSSSFLAAAATVHSEGKGIQVFMRDYTTCITYLQSILKHIDGILYYGVNGQLNMRLIRDDYEVSGLQVITPAELLDDPIVDRGSWLETFGEIQIQYNKRYVIPDPD
jgi:hypothetical protein